MDMWTKEEPVEVEQIGTKVMPSEIAALDERAEAGATHYPKDVLGALEGRPDEPPEYGIDDPILTAITAEARVAIFYVSGPMTGYDGHNFNAFDTTEKVLNRLGFQVLSPAQDGDLDDEGLGTASREEFMRRDIDWVLSADGVVVLDGWEMSRGSRLEVAVAREIGLPIFRLEGEKLVEEDYTTTLEEALEIAGGGSRQQAYGHPIHNMRRTAQIWSGILGIDVTEEEVALCMIGVKLARESFRPQRDNLVDISGYGLVYEQIRRGRETLARGGKLPNVDRQREIGNVG